MRLPWSKSPFLSREYTILVLQRQFCVRTAFAVTHSEHSATFVLPQSVPDRDVSL